ncbi:MAG: hypothetical protein GY830_10645, partial [Bacteroidetes bacterium]|nr:hypothetical protein [Bacteroidota bacterium]
VLKGIHACANKGALKLSFGVVGNKNIKKLFSKLDKKFGGKSSGGNRSKTVKVPKVKLNLNKSESFKGACPKQIKEYLKKQGWRIEENVKKGKPGFRAYNPKNDLDVIKVIEVDKSKLKPGTNILKVKQGTYLKRGHEGWDRVPLKDNPNLN